MVSCNYGVMVHLQAEELAVTLDAWRNIPYIIQVVVKES